MRAPRRGMRRGRPASLIATEGMVTRTLSGSSFLSGALPGLVAPAGHEADAVLPCAERCGVEHLEQLGVGADIGRLGRDELGVGDDRVSVGGIELGPLVPGFQLFDGGALASVRAPRLAARPRCEARRSARRAAARSGQDRRGAGALRGSPRRRAHCRGNGSHRRGAAGAGAAAIRPRACRAAGRRPAIVSSLRSARSWSSATARNRWLPPRAERASRWSVSGGSGSGGGPPARSARSLSRWSSAGICAPS